jgi:3-dehydroquinate synthase
LNTTPPTDLSAGIDVDFGPAGTSPDTYPIHIGTALLDQTGAMLRTRMSGNRIAVVSNTTVAPLYLERVGVALQREGWDPLPVILPDGESHKNSETLHRIFDALITARCERSTPLLALGGGVIGDMTGFAAACYLRGVPFVQVPTTLLAQVDASVGGKTGINHPLGKNLIGAFHQPRMVLIDVTTLQTLPRRELVAGMAEVIKHGAIADEPLFSRLETTLEPVLALSPDPLIQVIHTCCTIKARIVGHDERERGERALLNFGHTFGHAVETLTGYTELLHGEAVAVGMCMAARLSRLLGLCDEPTVTRLQTLIARTGLPTRAPAFPVADYLAAMAHDKKVDAGDLRFVLLTRTGQAVLHRAPPMDAVQEAIRLTCA